MVKLCSIGGLELYKIENGFIKDFYGKYLYIIDDREVREWSSRFVIYKFDGNIIRDFYGRHLYSFDGHYFKEFGGKILYVYERGQIAAFASIPKYQIKGDPKNMEVAMFIILFIINK